MTFLRTNLFILWLLLLFKVPQEHYRNLLSSTYKSELSFLLFNIYYLISTFPLGLNFERPGFLLLTEEIFEVEGILESDRTGFQSQLCDLLAQWTWTSYLTLSLNFFSPQIEWLETSRKRNAWGILRQHTELLVHIKVPKGFYQVLFSSSQLVHLALSPDILVRRHA